MDTQQAYSILNLYRTWKFFVVSGLPGEKRPKEAWRHYLPKLEEGMEQPLGDLVKVLQEQRQTGTCSFLALLPPHFVVLDFDNWEDASCFDRHLKQAELETYYVQTRRGVHFYFKVDKPYTNGPKRLKLILPNGELSLSCDLKTWGGLVVIPPTEPYTSEWEKWLSREPLELPSWVQVEESEVAHTLPPATVTDAPGGRLLALLGKLSEQTRLLLGAGVGEGQRNNTLYRVYRDCLEAGVSREEALVLWNDIRCYFKPELPPDEVLATLNSVYKEGPGVVLELKDTDSMEPMPISDLLQRNPKLEWAWESIWPKQSVFLVAGLPKTGKTSWVYQFLAHRGKRFGMPVAAGNALVLSEESWTQFTRKLQALNVTNQVDYLPLPVTLQALERIQDRKRYDYIVVDSLGATGWFKDENNAVETQNLVQALKRFCETYGCSLLLLHHQNKIRDYGNVLHAVRGSTGLTASVDVIALLSDDGMTQLELEVFGRETGRRRIYFTKADVWQSPESFDVIRWSKELL